MKNIKSNDINKDIEALKLYRDCCYDKKIESSITDFCDIDMIFKWTNENLSLYPNKNLESKKVLAITSSGDHALDAVLNGAKKIDCIDINRFCKYYSALKIAMIKKYNYDDFFKNIKSFTKEMYDLNNFLVLEEISIYLTNEDIKFWNAYLNTIDSVSFKPTLFYIDNDSTGNRYRKREQYNSLKEKLSNVEIKYYDGDIIFIDEILKNNMYDVIYLSNVFERIIGNFYNEGKRIKNINNLMEKLYAHLNDTGYIYNYFLGLTDIKMENVFGKYGCVFEEKFDIKYYKGRINQESGALCLQKK